MHDFQRGFPPGNRSSEQHGGRGRFRHGETKPRDPFPIAGTAGALDRGASFRTLTGRRAGAFGMKRAVIWTLLAATLVTGAIFKLVARRNRQSRDGGGALTNV